MQNTPNKTNVSSEQVLKTFKVLLQGDYTMQELLSKLNADEINKLKNEIDKLKKNNKSNIQ